MSSTSTNIDKLKQEFEKLFSDKIIEIQEYYLKFETHRANDNFREIKNELNIMELIRLKNDFRQIESHFEELLLILNKKQNEVQECVNQLNKLEKIRDDVLNMPITRITKNSNINIVQNHFGTGDNIGRDQL